jgi:SOS-response transcriptional repressor LexA
MSSITITKSPSFYAIIPAHVRYSRDLESGAKLLYGEITALCHEEGYCWATNEYFAQLYDTDIRTIQRWLSSLNKQKFIKVEIKKDGIQVTRNIWISPEIQKMFTTRQKCHPPMTKMSGGHDKNVMYNNTYNNTKNTDTPIIPKGDAVEMIAFGDKIKIKKSEYEELTKQHSLEFITGLIEEMKDYLLSTGKSYRDYGATLRNWIRKRIRDKSTSPNPNIPRPAGQKEENRRANISFAGAYISDNLAPRFTAGNYMDNVKILDHVYYDKNKGIELSLALDPQEFKKQLASCYGKPQ